MPAAKRRRASASSTRRWCTSRGLGRCSRSARRRGASPTSLTTACSSRPLLACRASSRSGTVTRSDVRWSWVARSARSPEKSPNCREIKRFRGSQARGSTSGRPTTCCRTSPSSRILPGTCPTTARSSSSDSATSWATGGSSSTHPSARRCTRRGRSRSPPGCASTTGLTSRACTPTTASCCASPTPTSHRRRSSRCSPPTRSTSWSPARSAGRRCSPRGFASARRARCCCPADVRIGARRCGNSVSGPRNCSRWQANTRRSRSFWRRCANACKTCSTSPA